MLANSKDPDQTLASAPGLHCLPMSQNWEARLIWVKTLNVMRALCTQPVKSSNTLSWFIESHVWSCLCDSIGDCTSSGQSNT